jgi:hypothetical protein
MSRQGGWSLAACSPATTTTSPSTTSTGSRGRSVTSTGPRSRIRSAGTPVRPSSTCRAHRCAPTSRTGRSSTGRRGRSPVDVAAIGEFLRCAMGLSAWKSHRGARWELRVNPSSGNLHPTEAYVVHEGRVCHYAPREHALEERCVVDPAAWRAFTGGAEGFLVGLTSIALARGLEVRRAGVPLLPARCRACHRRTAGRGGAPGLAADAAPEMVGYGHRDAARRESRGRCRRRRARRGRLPGRGDARCRGPLARGRPGAAGARGCGRGLAWHGESAEPAAGSVARHRSGGRRHPVSGTRGGGAGRRAVGPASADPACG